MTDKPNPDYHVFLPGADGKIPTEKGDDGNEHWTPYGEAFKTATRGNGGGHYLKGTFHLAPGTPEIEFQAWEPKPDFKKAHPDCADYSLYLLDDQGRIRKTTVAGREVWDDQGALWRRKTKDGKKSYLGGFADLPSGRIQLRLYHAISKKTDGAGA